MVYFLSSEVQQLLHNKYVVVLGDSIQRAVYKDLVLLLQKDSLLTEAQLRVKGELSFEHDHLVAGGQLGGLHNGTHYREVRQFLSSSGHHLLRFYFLTRVYSAYMEDVLTELENGPSPDLIIINSCLWDLSRYGGDAIRSYQENLECLFERMEQVLPASCLLVWTLAMPLAERLTGGFLLPRLRPETGSLRTDVLEANFYCSILADGHHFDVLDLHFHFRHAVRHRCLDGIHWDQHAHRHLSQLLLAHVAEAWGVEAPRRSTPLGERREERSSLDYRDQRSRRASSSRHTAQPSEETLPPWRYLPQADEDFGHQSSLAAQEWSLLEQPVQGAKEPTSRRRSSHMTEEHPVRGAKEPTSRRRSSHMTEEHPVRGAKESTSRRRSSHMTEEQPVRGAKEPTSWRRSSHMTEEQPVRGAKEPTSRRRSSHMTEEQPVRGAKEPTSRRRSSHMTEEQPVRGAKEPTSRRHSFEMTEEQPVRGAKEPTSRRHSFEMTEEHPVRGAKEPTSRRRSSHMTEEHPVRGAKEPTSWRRSSHMTEEHPVRGAKEPTSRRRSSHMTEEHLVRGSKEPTSRRHSFEMTEEHPVRGAKEPTSRRRSSQMTEEHPVRRAKEPTSWRRSSQMTQRSLSFEAVAQETDYPLTWPDRQLQSQLVPLRKASPQVLPQDSFSSDNPVLPGKSPRNYVPFSDPLPPPTVLDSTLAPQPLDQSCPYRQRHHLVRQHVQRHVRNGPYSRARERGPSRQWSRHGQNQ